jgi:hypothetical protein
VHSKKNLNKNKLRQDVYLPMCEFKDIKILKYIDEISHEDVWGSGGIAP